MKHSLQPIKTEFQKVRQLEAEFARARESLQDSERCLAEEQAAVNAFRMHCRLTIGHWVDTLIDLRSQKQGFLTQKRLLEQDLGIDSENINEETNSSKTHSSQQKENVDNLASSILEELIDADAQREAEKSLYRDLARRFHPDLADTDVEKAYRTSIMSAINVAYQQRDLQTLRDLAGEIDPKTLNEINAIDSSKIRKLRERIVRCQRYERKVQQQLKALRQENTAKLWQKSQEIEQTQVTDWWHAIKNSLEEDVVQLEVDVANLQEEVQTLETQKENRQEQEISPAEE
ncbi:MAG: hypothetical protein AAF490_09115 [Chloroflexota bacterium]